MGERTMTVHIWYMRVACNLRPIGIALRDNKGVDTGCMILLTSKIRPTVDHDNSEPPPSPAICSPRKDVYPGRERGILFPKVRVTGGCEVAEHVWYVEALRLSDYNRGYVPLNDPALTVRENRNIRLKILYRMRHGEDVAPEELPGTYVYSKGHPGIRLDVPLWWSAFIQVREDVADVLRRFDLGRTLLCPVTVELAGGKGEDHRYLTLATSNIRPTIDPENSEAIGYGQKRRESLMCEGKVHLRVRALRSAPDGPAIWTDPGVNDTLFLNDDLAQALLDEPFGHDLQLKQVRLVEARKGLPNPARPSA